MSTQLSNPTAVPYLARVRSELSDIPWQQREELLATVSERLGDLAANESPWSELGSPVDFARQLRDSAGLPARRRNPVAWFRATRVRAKIVIAVTLVVMGVLIAVAVEWPHYQPLSANAYAGGTNARRVDDSLATGTEYFVYASGKYIYSGIELRNHGQVPVTVDGVSIATSKFGPLVLRELRATANANIGGDFTLAPKIDHVTVQPGKMVVLFVVMKMQLREISYDPGSGVTLDQPRLRVRVLGTHHLVRVQGDQIGILFRRKP